MTPEEIRQQIAKKAKLDKQICDLNKQIALMDLREIIRDIPIDVEDWKAAVSTVIGGQLNRYRNKVV